MNIQSIPIPVIIVVIVIIITIAITSGSQVDSSGNVNPPINPPYVPPSPGTTTPPDPQPQPIVHTVSITFTYDLTLVKSIPATDNIPPAVATKAGNIRFVVISGNPSDQNQQVYSDTLLNTVDGTSITITVPEGGGVFVVSQSITDSSLTLGKFYMYNVNCSSLQYYDYPTVSKLPNNISICDINQGWFVYSNAYCIPYNGGCGVISGTTLYGNPSLKNLKFQFDDYMGVSTGINNIYGIDKLLGNKNYPNPQSLSKYTQITVIINPMINNSQYGPTSYGFMSHVYLNFLQFCPIIKVIDSFDNQTTGSLQPADLQPLSGKFYQQYYIPDAVQIGKPRSQVGYEYYIQQFANDVPFSLNLYIPDSGGVLIGSAGFDNKISDFHYYPYTLFQGKSSTDNWYLNFVYSAADGKIYSNFSQ